MNTHQRGTPCLPHLAILVQLMRPFASIVVPAKRYANLLRSGRIMGPLLSMFNYVWAVESVLTIASNQRCNYLENQAEENR